MKLIMSIAVCQLFIFLTFSSVSQNAGLNPTIINGNVILCPNGQETLATQEYDTYQWYKNGNLIPGATQQNHVVTYFEDVGSSFSVFVTQGAQSAMSPSIFVDGYLFMPLVVSNYGQGFWFTGESWEMCEYHELFFEVMMPYNTNIQWYKNGVPIFGANHPVFRVLETGVYAVSGSPQICPNYVQYSLDLPVIVHVPPQPVITQSADTLFSSVFPGQWYAGDDPIPGASGQYLVPDTFGWYSFEFTDSNGCKKMSEPFYFEWDPVGLTLPNAASNPEVFIRGNVLVVDHAQTFDYTIYSLTGALMSSGIINQQGIDISHLPTGMYFIHLNNGSNHYVAKFVKQ